MEIYQPAEDSFFLAEIVNGYLSKLKNKDVKILDVGTGSGIQAKNCIDGGVKPENITSIDINPVALKKVEKLGVNVIKSDLFQNIKESYDLVVFNPPYLPGDKFDCGVDTTGGEMGDETIIRFVADLKSHLKPNGVCFVLTSSFTPRDKWKKIVIENKLKVRKIKEKKMFQESLFVWKITA